MAQNPFAATFGADPALLVGRDSDIAEFKYALENGPGQHARVSLVVGQRGTGKTVLLSKFESIAKEKGWLVFNETATKDFTSRLKSRLITYLKTTAPRKALASVGLNVLSFGFSLGVKKDEINLEFLEIRELLEIVFALQEKRAKKDANLSGVFITVDELHHQRKEEMVQFGATVQHLVRDGYNIAVAMAGIPSSIDPLLSAAGGNPITFLRRANRIELGRVPDDQVRYGISKPLAELGYAWQGDALNEAVAACKGYPFLIQLVGAAIFKIAQQDKLITSEIVAQAGAEAKQALGRLVLEPALKTLSEKDLAYLEAMSKDDGASKVADISQRLGKKPQELSVCRARLIDKEVIAPVGRGLVAFILPYMREYVRTRKESPVNIFD